MVVEKELWLDVIDLKDYVGAWLILEIVEFSRSLIVNFDGFESQILLCVVVIET